MALLFIGGTTMPTPTEMTLSYMDISKADRNAAGRMVLERITTKRKLAITYSYISASDLSTVLNAISPTSYSVMFLDAKTNAFVTTDMYCGDRSVGMISYVNNIPMYKDFTFDLIEM